jgi:hypothetical protein
MSTVRRKTKKLACLGLEIKGTENNLCREPDSSKRKKKERKSID